MILLGTRLEAPEDDHDDVCHDEDDDDPPPHYHQILDQGPAHLTSTPQCVTTRGVKQRTTFCLSTFPFTLNFSKSKYECAYVWKKT